MITWLEDDDIQAPVTDEQRKEAEVQLQVQLPEAFVALLQQQNGGYIEGVACPTAEATSWADDHIQLDHIFGITESEGILDSPYLINEWGLPEKLVVINGDGHGWVALDYRAGKTNPKVIHVDTEMEKEQELAPTFADFLTKLIDPPEEDE